MSDPQSLSMSRSCFLLEFGSDWTLLRLPFGPFLNPNQLMPPEPFESARPFVQRLDGHGIHPIKHLPTLPPGLDEANIFQDLQVLRNGRLLDLHCGNNLAD